VQASLTIDGIYYVVDPQEGSICLKAAHLPSFDTLQASLTIDGIYYVVDPGFAKQKVFNPKVRSCCISAAAAMFHFLHTDCTHFCASPKPCLRFWAATLTASPFVAALF